MSTAISKHKDNLKGYVCSGKADIAGPFFGKKWKKER